MPLAVRRGQVPPGSAVRQIVTDWVWHWAAELPSSRDHPLRSSTNEIHGEEAAGGSGRCCQLWPPSVERNRTLLATSTHRVFAEGTLSQAVVGSGISAGETVGVGVEEGAETPGGVGSPRDGAGAGAWRERR